MDTPNDAARGTRNCSLPTDSRTYTRVGTKGQFVVPAKLRRELHIEPGQSLRLEVKDGRLIATPLNGNMIHRLRGILAGPGLDPLAELMREHREEIERDEAEEALWRERQRQREEEDRERAKRLEGWDPFADLLGKRRSTTE